MRLLLAAAIVMALATPTIAQQHVQQAGEPDKEKTPAEIAADKAAAEAYNRSLGAIPDKGSSDPWGTMRSNDGSKAAATKTAKAKAKAGGSDAKPQ